VDANGGGTPMAGHVLAAGSKIARLSHKQKWLLVPVASQIAATARKNSLVPGSSTYIRFQRKVFI